MKWKYPESMWRREDALLRPPAGGAAAGFWTRHHICAKAMGPGLLPDSDWAQWVHWYSVILGRQGTPMPGDLGLRTPHWPGWSFTELYCNPRLFLPDFFPFPSLLQLGQHRGLKNPLTFPASHPFVLLRCFPHHSHLISSQYLFLGGSICNSAAQNITIVSRKTLTWLLEPWAKLTTFFHGLSFWLKRMTD